MHRCVWICVSGMAGKADRWPGGTGGGHEPSEFRLLGPSETIQVSYKKSFVLTPFELWWASGLFRDLSESQAGREEEEVTSVHIYVCISGRLLDQFGFTSLMLCSRCCTS